MMDDKIEAYYALKPAKYGFLEELSISQTVDPKAWRGLVLAVTLRSSEESVRGVMRLEFWGVRNLKVNSFDGLMRYGIDIRSISEDQLEGLKYRVTENEHALLSFVCDAFSAEVE
jgi:hypothetical protein